MKIKIITDSTCDLSPELVAENNITLVPLTIIKDGQPFKDGITITPADIFAHVAAGGNLCSTSANSVGEYADLIQSFEKDFDGILIITIGSSFSSCFQNANIAAEDYDNVSVIDSKNLSTGQGLLVLKAVDLVNSGLDLEAITAELNALADKVEASFLLDELRYMVKGGRCSSVVALGANLLNLKPCIEVKDGKMSVVKKYRGNYAKCLESYVKDRLSGRMDDLDDTRMFLTHTPVNDACHDSVKRAVEEYGKFETVYETEAGCTVSCHCGPGTLGVLFIRK